MKTVNVDARSSQWFVRRTGYWPGQDAVGLAALSESGAVLGMVLFDNWKPNSARIHAAVHSPLCARALLRHAMVFFFLQSGRSVLLGCIAAHNRASLKMAKRVGFEVVHRVKDGWEPGVDLVSVELRKENCKWLPKQKEGTANEQRNAAA